MNMNGGSGVPRRAASASHHVINGFSSVRAPVHLPFLVNIPLRSVLQLSLSFRAPDRATPATSVLTLTATRPVTSLDRRTDQTDINAHYNIYYVSGHDGERSVGCCPIIVPRWNGSLHAIICYLTEHKAMHPHPHAHPLRCSPVSTVVERSKL